jgi:uncharacterized protein YndB with AHSA1/START domain
MFKKIALTILGLLVLSVGAVLAVAATKPDDFRVTRTTTVNTPPEQIYPMIVDLKENLAWMPFDKDPNAKRTWSANTSGPGATYAWEGNSDVGKGDIAVTEATSPSRVAMKLHMIEPMEAVNDVEFTLAPAADGKSTDVTWTMYGPQPFIGKVLSTLIDCDKMIGTEFEKGLASLKGLAEKKMAAQ